MARIRSVRPELRTSLTAAQWPREVRYFWVLLSGYLDDHGRGVDEARLIKADCFPLDDDLTAADVGRWLDLFAEPDGDEPAFICRYVVGGRRYLHAPHWRDEQKPQHPADSKIPPCPRGDGCGRGSGEPHEPLMRTPGDRSGTLPDPSGSSGTSVSGINHGGSPVMKPPADPGFGAPAGQSAFMNGSGDSHESLSGNSVSNTPSPTSVRRGEGEVDGEVGGEGESITPAKPPRPDVERLCTHLADRIEANGSKRPNITQKWRDSARLMLDNDKRTEQQVHDAIDWCQDSEFWRANVLSMPKLRDQYEQLRLQAQREQGRASPARAESTGAERAMAAIESGRRLQKLADEGKLTL